MTDNTAAPVLLGPTEAALDIDPLIRVERLQDIPEGTTLIVVPYDETAPATLATLRRHRPNCDAIAWIADPSDTAALEVALSQGFDHVALGTRHLSTRLGALAEESGARTTARLQAEAQEQLAELIHEMAAHPELQSVLHTAIIGMSRLFAIDKVSVVLYHADDDHAFVVAEHDQALDNVLIQLAHYPELREVARTGEPLLISDIIGDALMAGVRRKLEEANVQHRSAMLFPLRRKERFVGALFLRSTRLIATVEDRLMSIGRLVASVTAVAVGNALETDMLLNEQRALMKDKADTVEMLESLKPFSEFFEQAKDGIVVCDAEGQIRYSNASAAAVLRGSAASLEGQPFIELLLPRYRGLAERAFAGSAVGDSHGYVDLLVPADDDDETVISAAIRPLQQPPGTLVSFRDVTELREIESELRQTKEFLENLIQSSVDAIISADTAGDVILFNRAAEQMLGYSAREAVERLNITDLFGHDEADNVMRRLRSQAYGGRGRLRIERTELGDKSGAAVPVNLTAATIYEGTEEIASVFILTDQRERMRIEQKLDQAQRQLQLSERQSVVVELAGTAAHELNQPLTSILGYAELLKRRIDEGDKNRKPVDVIIREVERMAGIVKRVGELTAYKSTSYVGGSKILDLSGDDGRTTDGPASSQDKQEPES